MNVRPGDAWLTLHVTAPDKPTRALGNPLHDLPTKIQNKNKAQGWVFPGF